jgi:hypothetical protein
MYDEIKFIAAMLARCPSSGGADSEQGTELDKPYDWLEFQVSVAVLTHALLLIASLFAQSNGAADVALCQSEQGAENAAQLQQPDHTVREWARLPHQRGVRVYAAFRARDVAPLRVLGRCVVKPAPEHQQPVLFGSFATSVDDSDDENLASEHSETNAPFPFPAVVGVRPTAMYVLRAPRTQLERPPRV